MKTFDRILYSEGFALTLGAASLLAYFVGDSLKMLVWASFWLVIAELRRLLRPLSKSLKVTVHAQDYADFAQGLEPRRNTGGVA